MYEERYDNHFRRVQAARDTFATFADYTAEALQATGTPKLIRDLLPALQAALKTFRQNLTGRSSGSGQRQQGTQTEDQAFAALKAFVQATDKKLLQPRFYDQPAEQALFYPDKLSGLTRSPKGKVQTRYSAYTRTLTEHAEPTLQAAGAAITTLLTAYGAATAAKNQGAKAVKDTVEALGPDAVGVADALWAVHCAALYTHREQPSQARVYFAYDRLPNPNPARRRAQREAVASKA
jgi:hypothetical protein